MGFAGAEQPSAQSLNMGFAGSRTTFCEEPVYGLCGEQNNLLFAGSRTTFCEEPIYGLCGEQNSLLLRA
ncbi:hypothetical protein RRG08_015322 [Elysia crispata]|uniref:Uncharacterized protein n=1 Tax=Elysia crispata TaxID=231223 RepID=A0AAE1DZB4_9GAST|nr:hypothetical protein RRG08_015322 [Elysia crispata]